MIRILFVCLGNICRSPTAEAVFRARANKIGLLPHLQIDSCGTGDWHIGKSPDGRSQRAAATRGYDLSTLTARQLAASDFERFDFILAMDAANLRDIKALRPSDCSAHVARFLDYHPDANQGDVPDPYYGGDQGFDQVLDLIEAAADGLLATLAKNEAVTLSGGEAVESDEVRHD